MPRTKMPRSKQKEFESIAMDFKRQAESLISRRQNDIEMELREFETSCEMLKAMIPQEIRNMTLREFIQLSLEEQEEESNVTSTVDVKSAKIYKSAAKPRQRRSRSASQQRVPTACSTTTISDDGYATEDRVSKSTRPSRATTRTTTSSRLPPMPASKKVKHSITKENKKSIKPEQDVKQKALGGRRSRSLPESADANDETPDNKADGEERVTESSRTSARRTRTKAFSSSAFKTPATKPMSEMNYAPITPKIKPNSSVAILRRPRDGETVVSMQGSPLLVSSVVEEKTVNVNVPLKNGNMMSMLPKEGFRKSQIPKLEQSVKDQLALIKKNIDLVLKEDS